MGVIMTDRELDTDELIRRAVGGDEVALAELFACYQNQLLRMVRLRLDRRLQGRLDPSDVLQEAYLDLSRELPRYAATRPMEFFLWLRVVVSQRLMRIHRQHLGAQVRDAAQELSLFSGPFPQASSVSLASRLMGRLTTASEAAMRAEVQLRLQDALNDLEPLDREIIALRNFEELSNREAAAVVGLTPAAASKRYIRALTRLQRSLKDVSGLHDEEQQGG
jgi:RNA polymerase sigma-70 factor (ECF subfamily)